MNARCLSIPLPRDLSHFNVIDEIKREILDIIPNKRSISGEIKTMYLCLKGIIPYDIIIKIARNMTIEKYSHKTVKDAIDDGVRFDWICAITRKYVPITLIDVKAIASTELRKNHFILLVNMVTKIKDLEGAVWNEYSHLLLSYNLKYFKIVFHVKKPIHHLTAISVASNPSMTPIVQTWIMRDFMQIQDIKDAVVDSPSIQLFIYLFDTLPIISKSGNQKINKWLIHQFFMRSIKTNEPLAIWIFKIFHESICDETTFNIIAFSNSVKLAELVRKYINVRIEDSRLLISAIISNSINMIEYLVSCGCRLAGNANVMIGIIHYAANHGSIDVIRWAIEQNMQLCECIIDDIIQCDCIEGLELLIDNNIIDEITHEHFWMAINNRSIQIQKWMIEKEYISINMSSNELIMILTYSEEILEWIIYEYIPPIGTKKNEFTKEGLEMLLELWMSLSRYKNIDVMLTNYPSLIGRNVDKYIHEGLFNGQYKAVKALFAHYTNIPRLIGMCYKQKNYWLAKYIKRHMKSHIEKINQIRITS